MATITVSQQDVTLADKFLTQYLTDAIPDADFSKGSALRDFTIGAIAAIFAYLRLEVTTTRNLQSLKLLSQLPVDQDVNEAVDAILSNWFITRNPGRQTHIPVRLHFSKATDLVIAASTKFYRTSDKIFYINQSTTLTAAATDLVPTIAADGSVIDYTYTVSLIAAEAGTAYNLPAGKFASADPFNSYFLYAESLADGGDGKDLESTTDLLARAPDAITVRNLVNTKSIRTVLMETFSAIDQLVVTGMGDVEMVRDLSTEAVTGLRMHVGGFYDVFLNLPRTDVTESLVIGALYARADNQITVLRDATGFSGVTPGMVVKVTAGLADAPRTYIIVAVGADYVEVHNRTPFMTATDELAPASNVTYQIGTLAPDFNNVIASRATGQTSRKIAKAGAVLLAGQPVYRIKTVEVVDTVAHTVTDIASRVNTTPAVDQYQVSVLNPACAQSAQAVTQVALDPSLGYDGKTLRVTYETLVGYQDIQNYVTNAFNRTINANALARGFHPVYLSAAVSYKLKTTAATTPDPTAVAASIAAYINSFSSIEIISASAITTFIQNTYPDIGTVYPFTITYALYAPDGQQYEYATQDIVTVLPDPDHLAQLTNGAALLTPLPNASLPQVAANTAAINAANVLLRAQLAAIGVSDRVVRYVANAADVTCVQRG